MRIVTKYVAKGEETICAGSGSLHAEMIYAKSLALAVFTFGNAGLEISKAKQKGQQTSMSEACCGISLFSPPPLDDTSSTSSSLALFLLASKTWQFRLN